MGVTSNATVAVGYSCAYLFAVFLFFYPRWLPCQPPIVSTSRLAPVAIDGRNRFGLAFDRHDASMLYRSHFFSEHAGVLLVLAVRGLFSMVYVAATVLEFEGPVRVFSGGSRDIMVYLSHWTFTLFAVQGLLGVAVSARGLARRHNSEEPTAYDRLDKVFVVVYTTTGTISLFLVIIYWILVYEGGRVYIDVVTKHGGSALLLLLEVGTSRMPMTSSWLVFPTVYVFMYLAFTWVNYAVSRHWTYDVLDWTQDSSVIYYLLLPWATLATFWLLFTLVFLRERFLGRKSTDYTRAKDDSSSFSQPVSQPGDIVL